MFDTEHTIFPPEDTRQKCPAAHPKCGCTSWMHPGRQPARTPTSVPAPNVGDVLDSPMTPEGYGKGEVLWGVIDEGVSPAPLVPVRHLLLHQRCRFGIGELLRSIIGSGGTGERAIPLLCEAGVVDTFLVGHVVRQHRVRPYAKSTMHQRQNLVHCHSDMNLVALCLGLPRIVPEAQDHHDRHTHKKNKPRGCQCQCFPHGSPPGWRWRAARERLRLCAGALRLPPKPADKSPHDQEEGN